MISDPDAEPTNIKEVKELSKFCKVAEAFLRYLDMKGKIHLYTVDDRLFISREHIEWGWTPERGATG